MGPPQSYIALIMLFVLSSLWVAIIGREYLMKIMSMIFVYRHSQSTYMDARHWFHGADQSIIAWPQGTGHGV